MFSPAVLDDYRELPRGFHHMDGVFGIAGPGIDPRPGATAHLYDIAPTALYLAGLQAPRDGWPGPDRVPPGGPGGRIARFRIEAMDLPLAGEGAEATPYSAEEEAQIEESLRNLGTCSRTLNPTDG